jgi:putative sterol carrier protein
VLRLKSAFDVGRPQKGVRLSKQPVSREAIAKAFEHSPLFSDFLEPFPNLLGRRGAALGGSFKRIAQAMSKSKRTASIQFTIQAGQRARQWCVHLSPKGAEVSEGAVERPQLEIIADTECWTQVASGELAPLEAFGRGRLRVRGSVELARVLVRSLRR